MYEKIGILILLVVMLMGLVGCNTTGEPKEKENPVIRGTITQLNSSEGTSLILVEGEIEKDTSYDKAQVRVDEKTKIYKEDKEITMQDLEMNMVVEVYTDGAVAESYPVQMGADKIIVIDKGEEGENTEVKEKVAARGIITELNENGDKITILVEGKKSEDIMYDYASVILDKNTIIHLNDKEIPMKDLKERMEVEIYHDGEVALSYPVQMVADKVIVLNNGEIVEETPAIRGTITEISEEAGKVVLMVEGEKEDDTDFDKAKVTVDESTKIYQDETKMTAQELKTDMNIEIYYDGAVDSSYPVQMGADKILILE